MGSVLTLKVSKWQFTMLYDETCQLCEFAHIRSARSSYPEQVELSVSTAAGIIQYINESWSIMNVGIQIFAQASANQEDSSNAVVIIVLCLQCGWKIHLSPLPALSLAQDWVMVGVQTHSDDGNRMGDSGCMQIQRWRRSTEWRWVYNPETPG